MENSIFLSDVKERGLFKLTEIIPCSNRLQLLEFGFVRGTKIEVLRPGFLVCLNDSTLVSFDKKTAGVFKVVRL